MQPARFARGLVLLLVLGLAGSLAGCGSGANPVPTAEGGAAPTSKRDQIKNFQKQLKGVGAAPKGGAFGRDEEGAK
jgi:hypothetical protein